MYLPYEIGLLRERGIAKGGGADTLFEYGQGDRTIQLGLSFFTSKRKTNKRVLQRKKE